MMPTTPPTGPATDPQERMTDEQLADLKRRLVRWKVSTYDTERCVEEIEALRADTAALRAQLEEAKAALAESRKEVEARQKVIRDQNDLIANLHQDVELAKVQRDNAESALAELRAERDALQFNYEEGKRAFDEVTYGLEKQLAELRAQQFEYVKGLETQNTELRAQLAVKEEPDLHQMLAAGELLVSDARRLKSKTSFAGSLVQVGEFYSRLSDVEIVVPYLIAYVRARLALPPPQQEEDDQARVDGE